VTELAPRQRDRVLRAMAAVAVAFGLLTIASGGSTLFGGDAARQSAGAYVPFVLWFNFLAGFAYVLAGAGLWLERRWAVPLAFTIAGATLLVFAAFGMHVASGGAYEMRTVAAMTLRSVLWVAIAWVGSRRVRSRR
jgi:peptidoglycan/LPS O-acetylase OafA/YrhL